MTPHNSDRDSNTKYEITKSRGWDLGLSLLIFLAYLVASYFIRDKNALEDVKLAFVTAALTYAILRMRRAEQHEAVVTSRLNELNELRETFQHSRDDIREATEKLGILRSEAASIMHSVQDTVSNLYKSVGMSDQMRSLTEQLSVQHEHAAQISNIILDSHLSHVSSLLEVAKQQQVSQNNLLAYGWAQFVQAYLTDHADRISQDNQIRVTSGTYTKIVLSCCHKLSELYPGKNITLFMITAMLPYEFLNWRQVEFCTDSRFAYIGHTWAGSEDYFTEVAQIKEKVQVRRCILVRDFGVTSDTLLAASLRSRRDLENSLEYTMYDVPVSYELMELLELQEAFKLLTENTFSFENSRMLARRDSLKFYPVGPSDIFHESYIHPSRSIGDWFVNQMHTTPSDALYYSVPKRDVTLLSSLLSEEGFMPEIAVFTMADAKRDRSSEEPLFSIRGYLRPYTDSMRIQFLSNTGMPQEFKQALRKIQDYGSNLNS